MKLKIGNVTLESSYDLREHITVKVEDQNPYGICYAYAGFTPAETYWELKNQETIDFSEVHAAVLTTGKGGNFDYFNEYLVNKKGPVYEESLPMNYIKNGWFDNASRIKEALESETPSIYTDVISKASSIKPVKYITSSKYIDSIILPVSTISSWELFM